MKTNDAIKIICNMIENQEDCEDAILQDATIDEEWLHEVECDLEALRMAKRALERDREREFTFDAYWGGNGENKS